MRLRLRPSARAAVGRVVLVLALAAGLQAAGQPWWAGEGNDGVRAPRRTVAYSYPMPFFDPVRGRTVPHLRIVETDGTIRSFGQGDRLSFAPDGNRVAYASSGLWVAARDGTDRRLLVDDALIHPAELAWSPDGRTLLATLDTEVVLVDADTGAVAAVPGAGPVLSGTAEWMPGGQRILYHRHADQGSFEMVSMSLDGTDERVLSDGLVLLDTRVFQSADGQSILVEANPTSAADGPGLYVVPTDGGQPVALGHAATFGVVPRPDLQQLAVGEGPQLLLNDRDGNAVQTIPVGAAGDTVTPVLWTSENVFVVLVRADFSSSFGAVDPQTGAYREVLDDGAGHRWVIDPSAPRPPFPGTTDKSLVFSRLRDAGSADTVLIGRADDFADSLSSAGPQGALDAPLLLVPSDRVPEAVTEEISRLGATSAVVLGGEAAIGEPVLTALRGMGLTVQRVAGPDRIATAVAVAGVVADATSSPPTQVVLARAYGDQADPTRGFADSLAGGALAAGLKAPLLLTDTGALSGAVADYLDATPSVTEVVVLGGVAAVSESVVGALQARGLTVTRVAGPDRFSTAAAIRSFGITEADGAVAGAFSGAARPIVVAVDAADPTSWADGFAAAGMADPLDGGGVLLVAGGAEVPVATDRSIVTDPVDASVACGPLVQMLPCEHVSTGLATVTAPTSTLVADATQDGVTAAAVLTEGPSSCSHATVEGGQLAHFQVVSSLGTHVDHPADGGAVARCDRYAQFRGSAHSVMLDSGAEAVFVLSDGSEIRAPVQADGAAG